MFALNHNRSFPRNERHWRQHFQRLPLFVGDDLVVRHRERLHLFALLVIGARVCWNGGDLTPHSALSVFLFSARLRFLLHLVLLSASLLLRFVEIDQIFWDLFPIATFGTVIP